MTTKLQNNLAFILHHLMGNDQTLSVAESCTGGYLSFLLTSFPGSSTIFKNAFVTYSNDSKHHLLKIDIKDLQKLGAVSAEIAILMAQQIRDISKTSFGIGLTGNAGPTLSEKSNQVGEVYVSLSSEKETVCYLLTMDGTRDQIRKKSAEQAIHLFAEFIRREIK